MPTVFVGDHAVGLTIATNFECFFIKKSLKAEKEFCTFSLKKKQRKNGASLLKVGEAYLGPLPIT